MTHEYSGSAATHLIDLHNEIMLKIFEITLSTIHFSRRSNEKRRRIKNKISIMATYRDQAEQDTKSRALKDFIYTAIYSVFVSFLCVVAFAFALKFWLSEIADRVWFGHIDLEFICSIFSFPLVICFLFESRLKCSLCGYFS